MTAIPRGGISAKPWPLRRIQLVPHGVGVVADDPAAGLITLPVVHGVAWWLGGV